MITQRSDLERRLHGAYPFALGVIREQFRSQLGSRFDPEDFVQDAVVDVLRKPALFLGTDNPPQLLFTIAKRRMIDQYWHAFGRGRTPRPREYPASPWM